MTLIRGLSDTALRWLLVTALAALAIGAAALWWVHHRDTVAEARYQHLQDSLAVVTQHLRDTVAVLDERFRVDTVLVARTTTVYRQAAARVDTAWLVTPRGDTIQVDTLAPVRALRLACDATIAARDTALTTCEQRVAAVRRLAATDSLRSASQISYLQTQVTRAGRQGRATGRKQGAIATFVLVLGAAIAVRQIIPR